MTKILALGPGGGDNQFSLRYFGVPAEWEKRAAVLASET